MEKTAETQTPRTDSECAETNPTVRVELCEDWLEVVDADFSRGLEKELAESRGIESDLRAALKEFSGRVNDFADSEIANGGEDERLHDITVPLWVIKKMDAAIAKATK